MVNVNTEVFSLFGIPFFKIEKFQSVESYWGFLFLIFLTLIFFAYYIYKNAQRKKIARLAAIPAKHLSIEKSEYPYKFESTNIITYQKEIMKLHGDYVKKGENEAANLLPHHDAKSLDQHESNLYAIAILSLNDMVDKFNGYIGKIRDNIRNNQLFVKELERDTEICLDNQNLRNDIAQIQATQGDNIAKSVKINSEYLAKYTKFRNNNNLQDRNAKYPFDQFNYLSNLFILWLVEAVANMFYFQNENGLLGGIWVAMGVSGINIVVAAIAGNLFRYKNHIDAVKKYAGWAAGIIGILVIIYINAIFTAYRAEAAINSAGAFGRAVELAFKIFVWGLNFDTVIGFVLFGTGVLMGFAAGYKGYNMDDAYPGYRLADLQRLQFEAFLEEDKIKARELMSEKIGQFRHNNITTQARWSELSNTLTQLNNECDSALIYFHEQRNNIDIDLATVSAAYRNANKAIRANKMEPPKYFAEKLTIMNEERAKDPDINKEITDIKILQDKIEPMVKEYTKKLAQNIHAIDTEANKILGKELESWYQAIINNYAGSNK